MLNELYMLSNSMNDAGVNVKGWHNDYEGIRKGPCILVGITSDCSVHILDTINEHGPDIIRKYGNKHGSFPAFNVAPLYYITEKEQLDKLKLIQDGKSTPDLDELRRWCINDNWKHNMYEKIGICRDKSIDLLDKIKQHDCEEPECRKRKDSVVALATAFITLSEEGKSFRKAIETSIFDSLNERRNTRAALDLLFYAGMPKHGSKSSGSLSIVLEHSDRLLHDPVATPPMTEWINDVLVKSDIMEFGGQTSEERDAFGSPYIYDEKRHKKMPAVKLQWEVILRSMFSEQRCQKRYDVTEGKSYPMATENRDLIKKALEWISDKKREGTMWINIGREEIVFVYPSSLPQMDEGMPYASLIKSKAPNSIFEKCSKDFLNTFSGLSTEQKPSHMVFFVLSKYDKARTKIVYKYDCSPSDLINSAMGWQKGCEDILPLFEETSHNIPFPSDIAKIINTVWSLKGEKMDGGNVVGRIKHYQGISVLLEPLDKSTFSYFLHILLNNAINLVRFAGNHRYSL
jgi:hypothetical protein